MLRQGRRAAGSSIEGTGSISGSSSSSSGISISELLLVGVPQWGGGAWGGHGRQQGSSAASLLAAQLALHSSTVASLGGMGELLVRVDDRLMPSAQSLYVAGRVDGGKGRREVMESVVASVVATESALWGARS